MNIFFVSVPSNYFVDKWLRYPNRKGVDDLLSTMFNINIKFIMIGEDGYIFGVKVNIEEEATHFILKSGFYLLSKEEIVKIENLFRKHKLDVYEKIR